MLSSLFEAHQFYIVSYRQSHGGFLTPILQLSKTHSVWKDLPLILVQTDEQSHLSVCGERRLDLLLLYHHDGAQHLFVDCTKHVKLIYRNQLCNFRLTGKTIHYYPYEEDSDSYLSIVLNTPFWIQLHSE